MKAIKRGRPSAGKPTCHPRRKHHARGLCAECYRKLPDVRRAEAARKRDRDWEIPALKEINRVYGQWHKAVGGQPILLPHEQFQAMMARIEAMPNAGLTR